MRRIVFQFGLVQFVPTLEATELIFQPSLVYLCCFVHALDGGRPSREEEEDFAYIDN